MSACGASPSAPLGDGRVVIRALEVEPDPFILQIGQSEQLRVWGLLNDGGRIPLQASLGTQYFSQDTAVISVSTSGVVTAQQPGQGVISVEHAGLEVSVTVQVRNSIVALSLLPSFLELQLQRSYSVELWGTRADGQREQLSVQGEEGLQLESLNPEVVQVQGEQLLGVALGRTEIVARLGALEERAEVLVSDRALTELWGRSLLVVQDEPAPLILLGRFEDGSVEDLSALSSGTSYRFDAEGLDVDAQGNLRGLRPGVFELRASNQGQEHVLEVRVVPPIERLRLEVEAWPYEGGISSYELYALHTDRSESRVTEVWGASVRSDNPSLISAQSGVLFGRRMGNSTLRASWGALLDSVPSRTGVSVSNPVALHWAHRALSVRTGDSVSTALWVIDRFNERRHINGDPMLLLAVDKGFSAQYEGDRIRIASETEGDGQVDVQYQGLDARLLVHSEAEPQPLRLALRAPDHVPLGETADLTVLGYGENDAFMGPLGALGTLRIETPVLAVVAPTRVRAVSLGRTALWWERGQARGQAVVRVEPQREVLAENGLFFGEGPLQATVGQTASVRLWGRYDSGVVVPISADREGLELRVFGPLMLMEGPQEELRVRILEEGIGAIEALVGTQRAVLKVRGSR